MMRCKKCFEKINLDDNLSFMETYLDNKHEILLTVKCPNCKVEMLHFLDVDDID